MMRKKLVFVLFLMVSSGNLFAQKADMYAIIPGEGIGNLTLGITRKKAEKLVGKPDIRENYIEAIQSLEAIQTNPHNWVPFLLAFDSVYIYTTGSESYPVHSLYFKNDSLIAFSLSAFTYKKWWLDEFHVEGKVFFNDNELVLQDSVGYFYGILDYSQGRMQFKTYAYFMNGISIMLYKEKIKMIEVYRPLDFFKGYRGGM